MQITRVKWILHVLLEFDYYRLKHYTDIHTKQLPMFSKNRLLILAMASSVIGIAFSTWNLFTSSDIGIYSYLLLAFFVLMGVLSSVRLGLGRAQA